MAVEFAGRRFQYAGRISPERDALGRLREHMPQSRYVNRQQLPLHTYGAGSFCQFSIIPGWRGKAGVYIFLIDGTPTYIGKCDNLETRINQGYGSIQPRNCYRKGQETNCRINNLVLNAVKRGMKLDLLFHETARRDELEALLIEELSPEWNRQQPRHHSLRMRESPPHLPSASARATSANATCHEEVLAAAIAVTAAKGRNEFSPIEIIEYMKAKGSRYPESTIRTHVVSRCCANAPDHHAVVYRYFKRVGRGTYRILPQRTQ